MKISDFQGSYYLPKKKSSMQNGINFKWLGFESCDCSSVSYVGIPPSFIDRMVTVYILRKNYVRIPRLKYYVPCSNQNQIWKKKK